MYFFQVMEQQKKLHNYDDGDFELMDSLITFSFIS